MAVEKPLIFVSCGQYAQAEKKLGNDICALLEELRPDLEPYYAEEQSTVEGLSNHILKALHKAAGFICVMHRRGDITTPSGHKVTRGSVWIEQEIAIAAFIGHALGRVIPTFFYKENGVGLEGLRGVLLMNPRLEFTEGAQVLTDLRSILPSAAVNPFMSYDLSPLLSFNRVRGTPGRHDYSLIADVKNTGVERITDFRLRVYFPRRFLNTSVIWAGEDRGSSNSSHICLTADARDRAPGGLYSGDGMTNPLKIDYFVDTDIYYDHDAMQSEIKVELSSGAMRPKTKVYPIRDFQEF